MKWHSKNTLPPPFTGEARNSSAPKESRISGEGASTNRRRVFLLSLILLFVPTTSHAIELEIPLDCKVGEDCFIQNYVDTNPSGGYHDYMCGHLSYDGHKGTDFRLRNYVEMLEGVNVLAAAEGVVKAIRDGMPDVNVGDVNPKTIKGKECGNGVIIGHEDGWITQYCHMKRNSITVHTGDKVKAGEKIGQVGLSGKSAFPHMHLSVRHGNKDIDPFIPKFNESPDCIFMVSELKKELWSENALKQLEYKPTAILEMGFTDRRPKAEDARWGKHHKTTLPRDANAIVLWVDVMGTESEDKLVVEIKDPEGKVVKLFEKEVSRPQAQFFYFGGIVMKDGRTAWDPGVYTGTFKLLRVKNRITSVYMKKSIELTVK